MSMRWTQPSLTNLFKLYSLEKMMSPLKTGLATLTIAAFTSPALAADAFKIDPSHTHISFTVNHLGFSTTIGQFDDFKGTVYLDENKPVDSKVDVVIETASIDTNWEERNGHLRGKDWFNVDQFPTMTFKSTKVEQIDEKHAKVYGDLTLLGQTHAVVLDTVLNKLGKNPVSGQYGAGFTAETTIKRSEWGMTTFVPAVGDDVKIVIHTEAYK